MLSPELRERAEALVDRYPVGRSALLPLLHLVQAQDGYISDDGITECAQLLGLTKAEVNAVATFYTMYKREPMGRHLVSVCTNFSCKVRGAQEVYDRLSERLGVGHNGTTADGALTLEHAECLGNCEGAPVVTVDYLNYECLTPEAALELVERVLAGEVPPPTRGFPSPGIREIEYRLAGLGPRAPQPDELSVVSTSDAAPPPRPSGGTNGAPRRSEQQVADAGLRPDDVQEESSYSDREMPTTGQGGAGGASAPPVGGDRYPDQDPRRNDPEPPGDRDTSRLITSDGIADRPQTDELGEKRTRDG